MVNKEKIRELLNDDNAFAPFAVDKSIGNQPGVARTSETGRRFYETNEIHIYYGPGPGSSVKYWHVVDSDSGELLARINCRENEIYSIVIHMSRVLFGKEKQIIKDAR
jgi:hypothetical protein